MKLSVYNNQGKETGTMEVSDAVFAVKSKASVLHQVYHALLSNARQPWADTKDKSEVRGGGKKPWKQKGTGRARHGSIRSPIWKGGGVTFGPLTARNYKQKVNRKMNRLAVMMALSARAAEGALLVVEDVAAIEKTKEMAALRKALPGNGKSTLLLMGDAPEKVNLVSRNVPNLHMQRAIDVNVADLLNHQYLIATKEAVNILESRLEKK